MKANEFVKLRGISYCKELLIKADGCAAIQAREDNSRVSVDDLKRIVESHELVEMHGSTKWFFIANYCQEHRLAPHQSDVYSFVASKFDKAILDVESCQ